MRPEPGLSQLIDLVGKGNVVTLCGAGLSTDSGIPDYRGPDAIPRTPITFQEFARSDRLQQRYWARSFVGFGKFRHAAPNEGHHRIAELQERGYLGPVITQNVDGLQQAAGSTDVIDLHGLITEVICMQCRQITSRDDLQNRLWAANPGFFHAQQGTIAPDGDADIADTSAFQLVPCLQCGGSLKPHVVMFGETVEPHIVQQCYAAVDAADALLVLGSSLQVQSGLRFVRHASGSKPIAIVNRGATRGDRYADIRLDAGTSQVLREISSQLS